MKCTECPNYTADIDVCSQDGDTERPNENLFCAEAGDNIEDFTKVVKE